MVIVLETMHKIRTRQHSSRMRSARFSDSGGGLPTEMPPDRDPWTEAPLDRDPPDRGPLDRDSPGQRPPDRDSLEGTWDQEHRHPQKEHGTRQPDRK